jgi:hypothetical protein
MSEKIKFWMPPIPFRQPQKQEKTTNIRMACVVEDRLYHGLCFEGEILLLTPKNWQAILTYARIDFLLIESIWISSCGNWSVDRSRQTCHLADLIQVAQYARKQNIPTVFWMTKGHEYHELYQPLFRCFDYLFCADFRQIDKISSSRRHADGLQPCIQPAVYNPFRHYDPFHDFALNVLFDGLADLEKQNFQHEILKETQRIGLSIIESRQHFFKNRLCPFPEYFDSILGYTTLQGRLLALKYAKTYVTFHGTLSTPVEQQWMALEAGACRLPVIHQGELSKEDVRKTFAIECKDHPMDLLIELIRYRADNIYRERMGHKTWRAVHQGHTFSHRIKYICEAIGIKSLWEEFPKVSAITLVHSKESFEKASVLFRQQTYPNLEMLIVVKDTASWLSGFHGWKDAVKDIKLIKVPGEISDNTCMNIGHIQARGLYHCRLNTQDHYGPDYISDMILHVRSIGRGLFAKPPASLYKNNKVHHNACFPLDGCIVFSDSMKNENIRIDNNTICGHHEFFKKVSGGVLSFCDTGIRLEEIIATQLPDPVVLVDRFNQVGKIQPGKSPHNCITDRSRSEKDDESHDLKDFLV